jgi:hypothetical protein
VGTLLVALTLAALERSGKRFAAIKVKELRKWKSREVAPRIAETGYRIPERSDWDERHGR